MTDVRQMALLDADPDLGRLASPQQFELARRHLVVRRHDVAPGTWEGERLRDAGPEHVGLLVVAGLMTRELALSDNVSAELIGPGDVVRPWQASGPERLVRFDVRWIALEPTTLAVLDRRFAATLTRYPEVNAMLVDRIADRAQRLSVMQAISQLNGVDRRLLTLFWHLAERWGRVTTAGVAVPVVVPHRVLAQLVGARRPTVSSALSRLAEQEELVRQPDGGFLLTGAPVGLPTEEAARIVRLRRQRVEEPAERPEAGEELPVTGRIAELHDALAALRAIGERRREEFAEISERTQELIERIRDRRHRFPYAQEGR